MVALKAGTRRLVDSNGDGRDDYSPLEAAPVENTGNETAAAVEGIAQEIVSNPYNLGSLAASRLGIVGIAATPFIDNEGGHLNLAKSLDAMLEGNPKLKYFVTALTDPDCEPVMKRFALPKNCWPI